MRTSCRPPAVALLLVLVLAGCSDDSEPEAAAGASPSGARATPSASASAGPTTAPAPAASATASTDPPPPPAAVPSSAAPDPAPPAAPAGRPPAQVRPARLTGDGLDLPQGVVPFGTPVGSALPVLTAALGRPTLDTGVVSSFSSYGTCPGTQLRALEYGGGALAVLFGDVSGGGLTAYGWRLTPQGSPADLPRASALVGDAATYEFGVGTTVAALREGAGAVEVTPADEILPASFRLRDQSPGLLGSLTGTGPQDTVTFVQAGQPCGD